MKFKSFLLMAVVGVLLSSCGSTKEVPYVIDADTKLSQDVLQAASKMSDPTIRPGDMLFITVSGRTPESVRPFNRGSYLSPESGSSMSSGSYSQMGSFSQGSPVMYYLVDDHGNIAFPVLGELHLGGMKRSAAEEYIASLIYPKYLTEKPGVEVRLQNFQVYLVGEFNKPGVVTSSSNNMSVLEAISRGGDLTITAVRKNLMLIRTNADGSRTIKRINLNDPNLLVSPDYYLQQNDILYAQPNKKKADQSWQIPQGVTFGLSLSGTAISLATLIITICK